MSCCVIGDCPLLVDVVNTEKGIVKLETSASFHSLPIFDLMNRCRTLKEWLFHLITSVKVICELIIIQNVLQKVYRKGKN